MMSAGTLAVGMGANAPIPAAADTAGLDVGVVAITGIATLNGTDPNFVIPASAFPCEGSSTVGFPADGTTCPAGFAGACAAGVGLSVPDASLDDITNPTSLVGARVGSTGVGDGCGAVNNSGPIAYWEPPGGGLGTAQGTLVINETSGDGDATGDTFTEGFEWFRVGLVAATVINSVCESPCAGGPVPGVGAAASIFVPGVAAVGSSTCLPSVVPGPPPATKGCAGPWKVFIASVGAYLANGSD